MKNIRNNILTGTLAGILTPILTLVVIYAFKFSQLEFSFFLELIYNKNILSDFIALCGLPNLAVFYLFLRKNYYYSMRGVILATFILAGIVVVLKVF